MKHVPYVFHFFLLALCCSLLFPSCSKSDYSKIPKTGFISHYEENDKKQKPFLSYWTSDSAKTEEARLARETVYLYIKPVTTTYLTKEPSLAKNPQEITRLKSYFDESLTKAFKKREKALPNLKIVEKPKSGAYTLEVALLLLHPTPVEGNALKQALGIFSSTAGLVTGAVEKKGAVSFAARLSNPQGRRLVELADYGTDKSAIIGFDLKDFSRFAHHKRWMDTWSRELAETFTSPSGTKISGPAKFSLIPF